MRSFILCIYVRNLKEGGVKKEERNGYLGEKIIEYLDDGSELNLIQMFELVKRMF